MIHHLILCAGALQLEMVHVTSRMTSDDVTGVKNLRGNAIENMLARHLGRENTAETVAATSYLQLPR